MKYFPRRLVFSTLCAAFCAAFPSRAQNPPPPEAPPTAPSAPQTPAKKVWTNENISSVQGTVPIVGSSPSASDRSSRSLASTPNGATFINPKEGQIVHPGETIHIDLVVDSGITPVKAVGIISPMGFSNEDREGPPYSFTFTIPDKNLTGSSHRLIGFQNLTLFGTVVGRKDYDLAITTVDVEESDLPLSFFAASGSMSQWDPVPNHLTFMEAGEDERIDIYAKFPNGHELDVTESTYLSLSSENPAVAIATDDGTIASVGPGQTRIIVTYSLGRQQKLFYVPVTVDGAVGDASHSLEASPATFNFGDVPSNTASPPLRITVTNHTQADVHIFKLEPRGGFLVSAENCSDTILPPGSSCTITVTFSPIRPGPVHSNIFVPNSYTSMLSIFLLGKGT
jgi:archaellum component FlaF (FlaF/FlaG flagellin family)